MCPANAGGFPQEVGGTSTIRGDAGRKAAFEGGEVSKDGLVSLVDSGERGG